MILGEGFTRKTVLAFFLLKLFADKTVPTGLGGIGVLVRGDQGLLMDTKI